MIKIKNTKLGNVPKIAVIARDNTPVSVFKTAKKRGIDIFEVRIDQFKSIKKDYIIKKIKTIKTSRLPIIATIRMKKEGGVKDIKGKNRLELFKEIIPLVDAVDIELSAKDIINSVIKTSRQHKKIVIISYHNFKNTPSDKKLFEIIRKVKNKKADIVKIATLPKNKKDLFRLFSLTQKHKNENIITICLGNSGNISRVLFPFFGSLISYAYIDNPSAPGQLPFDKLKEAFKLYYR
jgi:3-dehydroquinate dehydratase type I